MSPGRLRRGRLPNVAKAFGVKSQSMQTRKLSNNR